MLTQAAGAPAARVVIAENASVLLAARHEFYRP